MVRTAPSSHKLTLLFTLLATTAAPVWAQEAPGDSASSQKVPSQANATPEGEEIIVTGFTSRSARAGLFGDQKISETPFSITAYTDELIATQQARTITDVTINDPSIRNNLSATSGIEQFTIRGFPLFASEVAVEGLYGMVPSRRTPIEAFDRVEVFKGPNALVNGLPPFGNIGGIINLVPKRAKGRTLDFGLYFQSDSQIGGNIDIGERFGEGREFGIRVNAARYQGDLTLDGAHARNGNAAAALDYTSGPLRLTLDFLYAADNYRSPDLAVTAGAGFAIRVRPMPTSTLINVGQRLITAFIAA